MADVIAELRDDILNDDWQVIHVRHLTALLDVAEAARDVANNDDFARIAKLMSNTTPMQWHALRAALARLEGR